MQQNKKPLTIGIAIGVGLLVLLIVLFVRSFGGKLIPKSSDRVSTIILNNGKTQFSVDSTGNAIWTTDGRTTSALWSEDKTNSFFAYYYDNWAQSATVTGSTATVSSNDELSQAVVDEGTGGGGSGGSGDGGGDISGYFGSPTPTPGNGGSGGSGGNGGSGGDNGAPSWCKHWRLSYCADPPPNTSQPTASPTPIPGQATPLPPDCSNSGNQETGRTVIGNELCLPSPTPTATP